MKLSLPGIMTACFLMSACSSTGPTESGRFTDLPGFWRWSDSSSYHWVEHTGEGASTTIGGWYRMAGTATISHLDGLQYSVIVQGTWTQRDSADGIANPPGDGLIPLDTVIISLSHDSVYGLPYTGAVVPSAARNGAGIDWFFHADEGYCATNFTPLDLVEAGTTPTCVEHVRWRKF